jgi:hypothetical protein
MICLHFDTVWVGMLDWEATSNNVSGLEGKVKKKPRAAGPGAENGVKTAGYNPFPVESRIGPG